jgi:hypothetical protein
MASLYEEGWRQGVIFDAELPLDAVVLDAVEKHPQRRPGTHGRWVIANQDCDLDMTSAEDPQPSIELRPVYSDDPPQDWGLRSARLRLAESDYVKSESPRTHVSAEVLTTLKVDGAVIGSPSFQRRRAFAIWLGKRYDRPAVPPSLLPLAGKIAQVVRARRNRVAGIRVRDVLMQFDESAVPVRYSLFAIIESAADRGEIRTWLAGIAQDVPPELGVADEIEAATSRGISLELIEYSYSADVTQLTWRPNSPNPEGAF